MTHIERIKKLLRLARSTNQHEAELAMQKAMAIAQEHRLSIESLDPHEDPAAMVTHYYTPAWASVSYDKQYAAKIAEIFFGCSIVFETLYENYRRKERIVFIGTAAQIEIGQYVFAFLSRHFAHAWTHHRGRCRKRQPFVYGMYIAIFTKLHLGRGGDMPANSQLALSHRAYIADLFGETPRAIQRKRPDTSGAAFSRGYEQGRQTQIHPGIKTTEKQTLRLT